MFKTLAESDEGKLHVLRVVYEVWKNHPQVRGCNVKYLCEFQLTEIIINKKILQFALHPLKMACLLASYLKESSDCIYRCLHFSAYNEAWT